MSEEIIKVLDDLSARFGVAIDWGSAKALPALQELFEKLVSYRMVMHYIYIIVAVFLIALCIHLIVTLIRDHRLCKNSCGNTFLWEIGAYSNTIMMSTIGYYFSTAVIIILPMSIIAGLYNSFKLIQLIMIPELYVLEYLMNIVN